MCGRYTVSKSEKEIKERFQLVQSKQALTPKYNATPSQFLPVISNQATENLSFYQWGLIPYWAKSDSGTFSTFNARLESIAEKSSLKKAFESQHCLVVADGYYEWKTFGKQKIPHWIHRKDKELFAMAGIWDCWNNGQDELYSFSIITMPASKKLSNIHERMPVILHPEKEKAWLSTHLSIEEKYEVLQPIVDEEINLYAVSPKVGNVRNDNETLIKPYSYGVQSSLF